MNMVPLLAPLQNAEPVTEMGATGRQAGTRLEAVAIYCAAEAGTEHGWPVLHSF